MEGKCQERAITLEKTGMMQTDMVVIHFKSKPIHFFRKSWLLCRHRQTYILLVLKFTFRSQTCMTPLPRYHPLSGKENRI